MKYLGLLTLIFIVFGSVHFALAQPVQPDSSANQTAQPIYEDRIVTRVNEEIITWSEVTRLSRQVQGTPKAFGVALQMLMREKLVLQAARKEGLKVSDAELHRILDQRIKELGGPEQFETMVLDPLKMSWEKYQALLHRDLIMQKYIIRKLSLNPAEPSLRMDFIIDTFVRPKEIRDYYQDHRAEFTELPKIRTRQIILLFEDAATKATKQSPAKTILEELAKGADFVHLVREYSEIKKDSGGLWEWTPPGTFPPKVEDIIWSLETGQVSSLIETKNSFRIIKIEDKITPQNNIDSLELQERIKAILTNKKYKEGQRKIIEGLWKQADIWIEPGLMVHSGKF